MKRRQILLLICKAAVSALLIWLVLRRIDLAGIELRLDALNFWWLLPSLVMVPASILMSAWRWHKLSLGLIGFRSAVCYTWIGVFFGTILPGFVGGDIAKGVSLATKNSRMRDARLPLSIITDKLVGFWVLLLLFGFASVSLLFVSPGILMVARNALVVGVFLALGGLGLGITACSPRGILVLASLVRRLPTVVLRDYSMRVIAAAGSLQGQEKLLWSTSAISLALHSMNVLAFWFCMRALSIPASLMFAAVFYPMLTFVLAIPVSISGVGVRDAFSAAIFTAFGLNPAAGVAFSWLLLLFGILSGLIGGCIQLFEMFRRSATG
jgi:uncharacterized membrane protein YbhN (UPF0104 family)